MLNVTLTPHLEFLSADKAGQKLFVMVKLRPSSDISASRPTTSFSFVIDTSGSMYDSSELGKAKIDVVIEALEQLISSSQSDARDRIALVQFDDSASILLPLTPATDRDRLENAISQLRDFSGGTCMALGMEQALSLLQNSDLTSRRTLIFTDGQTFDESDCRELAVKFAQSGIPITALGVGDYNEDLLIHLSDRTGGQLFNVIEGQSQGGTDISIADLPNTIFQQLQDVQTEVVNNLKLNLKTVQGVDLQRISRVYPDRADIPLDQQPYFIGSAQAHDDTVFLLEFDIDSRAGSRVRIAQLGLTYDIPGQQRRGELPPQNLIVQFVPGQTGMAQPNPEVMGYLQQCNIGQLVDRAATIADQNPDQAAQLLETAKRVTVKLGNDAMVQSLNLSIDEVRKTRKLSAGTRKTVKMGAKGKTVKMTSDDLNNGLSQDQIREISGT